MKDKLAEKVMELYGKGVKQVVIAETLNIPKWDVSRIVKKNTTPSESELTNKETLNGASNDNSMDESASGNPEIPGNSSEEKSDDPDNDPANEFTSKNLETPGQPFEDNSDVPEDNSKGHSIEDISDTPDDDPASDSPSENPEIPGQPFDGSEQMKTIAELTSAETARKLTDSYKEIFDLLGAANREIMETSMSGMDKGMRMLLTASERLNALSEKQEKTLASCTGNGNRADLQEESGNHILYLILALLLNFTAFCFGGICGTCDMLYGAVILCGLFLTATVLQLAFYPRSGKHKMLLSFSILGTAAAVTALLSGYFFFLIDKSILHIWLFALAGVPVGGIICLLHFLIQSKHEKEPK